MILAHGDYEIDDDRTRMDWEWVHSRLADTYWHKDLTRETVDKTAKHSALVVGAYRDGDQVGFLRVVSDTVRFAYLADVYVEETHRGKGLARAMVRFALEHPDYITVTRWCLVTRDAQGVYAEVGFTPLPDPEKWMVYFPFAKEAS
jgi:GNAT superfamily N-acetyltransferase